MSDFPKTLLEFTERFSTEEACWDYLREARWPDGFVCPHDGEGQASFIRTRGLWRCPKRHDTSVTAGTVMHRTHMPIRVWFWAAYLATTHTPGISACQLARQLDMRYETAFQILHKLRAGMVNPTREQLSGPVEMDETYVFGHRLGGKRGRALHSGKALVVGAVEVRGESAGRVRLRRVRSASAASLAEFAIDHVAQGSEIRTDGWKGYSTLRASGFHREIVEGEDSVDVAQQMPHIHRVFSNLKAWLIGTHHGVSPKHLQAYLNEYTFRFNRRRHPMQAFQAVLGIATDVRGPEYDELYAAGSEEGWTHPNPLEGWGR